MRLGRVFGFGGNGFFNGVAGQRLPSMHRRQRVLSLELMQRVWRHNRYMFFSQRAKLADSGHASINALNSEHFIGSA